jgi:hypothetical protein
MSFYFTLNRIELTFKLVSLVPTQLYMSLADALTQREAGPEGKKIREDLESSRFQTPDKPRTFSVHLPSRQNAMPILPQPYS